MLCYNKTTTRPIVSYLARQDVAKSREGVIEGLVVDGLVEIFDEDVAHATLPQRWIALGPHDAHRPALDHVEVHGVQRTLRCGKDEWEKGSGG